MRSRLTALSMGALALMTQVAAAQIAVSSNDGKAKLVNGVPTGVTGVKDTVTFIDLNAKPPKVLATIEAPGSVVGPPTSVAVTPNETLALVTAAQKLDPADATKFVWDDQLTVIDLAALKPSATRRILDAVRRAPAAAPAMPKVLATLTVGKGAAGVSINRAGTLALVANRGEGTISVLTIEGTKVTVAAKVDLGNDKAGPSAIVFTADGKMALVTCDGETANKIIVLDIDGSKVSVSKREINAGLRPYGIDAVKSGEFAVVANIGRGGGDADTISMIDLKAQPARVVTTVSVGQTPEGIKISPDGKLVAVNVINGSNKPKESPFFHDNGVIKLFRVSGQQLTLLGEVPSGHWCQGVVWSANSKTLLLQCMVEGEIEIFNVTGTSGKPLVRAGEIKVQGGPAGIRTAE
jgi:DNA-binding beta-propeller fold protein YncE